MATSGGPIEYVVDTVSGPLRFRAEAVQVSLDRNFIHFDQVSAREPNGRLLASADYGTATGVLPSVLGGAQAPLVVHANRVFGRIERLPNGRFRLQELLPVTKHPQNNEPFRVTVDDLSLAVDDYHGPRRWSTHASIPRLKVVGVGSRFVAWGKASVDQVGLAMSQVRHDPDVGTTINVQTVGSNIQPVLAHLIDTPDLSRVPGLRAISAHSLVLSADARIFVPLNGRAEYEANISADAAGFSYRNQFDALRGHFAGVLTEQGMKGVVSANNPGLSATYRGAFSWGQESVVGGELTARVDRYEDAPQWLRRFLPKGVRFVGADFNGRVNYSGGGRLGINGLLAASNAQYGDERAVSLKLSLDATGDRVAMKVGSGEWDSAPIQGALSFQPKSGQLEGVLSSKGVPLGSLAKRAGLKGVRGTADIQALILGTNKSPLVSMRATGKGEASVAGRRFDLGTVVMAADYADQQVNLSRITIESPDGVATGKGVWDRRTNKVNFEVVGSGIPLSLVAKEVDGRGSFLGRIVGTSKSPIGQGRVEVYGAKYKDQEIPLAFADVVADHRKVVATNVRAFKSAAQANGAVSLDLESQALSGSLSAQAIQLTDWISDQVVGSIEVPKATLGGTLKHVKLEGQFEGKNLVASRVKVDSVQGNVNVDGPIIHLSTGMAKVEPGSIEATGTYDLDSNVGSVSGSATGLQVAKLLPRLPEETSVTGILNGTFSAVFDKHGLHQGKGKGDFQNVAINDAFLGAGPFDFEGKQDSWTGSGGLGTLDNFLEVNSLKFDSKTRVVHANLDTRNFAIATAYSIAKRYMAAESDPAEKRSSALLVVPSKVLEELDTLAGGIDATANVDGKVDNPDISARTITASNLSIGGQPSGTMSADIERSGETWLLKGLTWSGGPGVVTAQGSIEEHGKTDLEGDIHQLNSKWLSLFDPGFSRFTGEGDIFFSVGGKTKSPEIVSSLYYFEGDKNSANHRILNVKANVKEGAITADGAYYYNGFTGPVTASLPFSYPFTIPKDKPLTAKVSLPARPLQDLQYLQPLIDPKRTNGSISGGITVYGPVDQLKIEGSATINAGAVAFAGVDTVLNDFLAGAKFDGTSLSFQAKAKGSQGGAITLENGNIGLKNLSEAVNGTLDVLLVNPVAGVLKIDDLKVVQKGGNPINASLKGQVAMTGLLRDPRLKGALEVSEGTVSIPTVALASGEPYQATVNPHFDIALSMPNPVTLKAGTGTFALTGSGKLAGSLALPDLDTELLVEKGSVRLPNARIAIDPGGTIHLLYQASPYGSANARADVNLTGSTALTANPYGGTIQRYDIDLQIRGDLLSDNGLQLSAQSDPPDLTQDKILTLLGQGGLFASQLNGAESYNPNLQFQTALFTALPLLLDPFTQQLATGLGLDYLNVEYNAFEKVSITAAKSFSKNLVLSGRRQLSSPLPGVPLSWSVRLAYRLPFRGKVFRNLNFNVGADQDRPWRVGLEYGFRF